MKNRWNHDKLTIQELQDEVKQGIIKIPIYQRGLVWDNQRKRDLIDSIKNGYPFGAVLIYQDKINNRKQIIDGLQRISTITEFINNPGSFFEVTKSHKNEIHDLAQQIGIKGGIKTLTKRVETILTNWIRSVLKEISSVDKIDTYQFYKHLKQQEGGFEGHDEEVYNTFSPIINDFKTACNDILNKEIPIIYVHGDETSLPDIFYRINTKGKPLTKYEVFRATWTDYSIYVQEDSLYPIIENAYNYYAEIKRLDIGLSDFNPDDIIRKRKLSFFDLCYGFGKMLQERFPALFGEKTKQKKIDGFGFTLINSCLAKPYEDIEVLNTSIREMFDDDEEICEFLEKMIDTTEFVSNILKKYSEFKLNQRQKSRLDRVHTELQIISIIVSVFLTKYAEISYDENGNIENIGINLQRSPKEWKQKKKIFKNNIERMYLIDIINRKWSGTGDKSLDDVVEDPSLYFKDVGWSYFERVIDAWFEQKLLERNEYQKVSSDNEQDRALLKTVYMKIFNAEEQLSGDNFDLEHIIPKNLMKDRLKQYKGVLRLPVSSVGNLAVLPEGINRAKKDTPLHEANTKIMKGCDPTEVAEKYLIPDKDAFEWLYAPMDMVSFKNEYMIFLNERFTTMKSAIKANLFPEEKFNEKHND